MMKKTLLYILNTPSNLRGDKGALKTLIYMFILSLTLGSCTRNHGDIGPWFGTWHVESITRGGDNYQYIGPIDFEGDYFFQFQSKVFRVSLVTDRDKVVESFGTWEENDGKMTINFPDPSVFYIEMPGLEAHNDFTVATTSSREITFTKTDATGTTFAYRLKKQP